MATRTKSDSPLSPKCKHRLRSSHLVIDTRIVSMGVDLFANLVGGTSSSPFSFFTYPPPFTFSTSRLPYRLPFLYLRSPFPLLACLSLSSPVFSSPRLFFSLLACLFLFLACLFLSSPVFSCSSPVFSSSRPSFPLLACLFLSSSVFFSPRLSFPLLACLFLFLACLFLFLACLFLSSPVFPFFPPSLRV